MEKNRIVYMNQTKTRWVNFVDGKKERVQITCGDRIEMRTVIMNEIINGATYRTISWDGILYQIPIDLNNITLLTV